MGFNFSVKPGLELVGLMLFKMVYFHHFLGQFMNHAADIKSFRIGRNLGLEYLVYPNDKLACAWLRAPKFSKPSRGDILYRYTQKMFKNYLGRAIGPRRMKLILT